MFGTPRLRPPHEARCQRVGTRHSRGRGTYELPEYCRVRAAAGQHDRELHYQGGVHKAGQPTEDHRRSQAYARYQGAARHGFPYDWIITSTRGVRTADVNTVGECFPRIFLDWLLIGTAAALVVDNVIPVAQIEAIECYTSITGMLPAFNR